MDIVSSMINNQDNPARNPLQNRNEVGTIHDCRTAIRSSRSNSCVGSYSIRVLGMRPRFSVGMVQPGQSSQQSGQRRSQSSAQRSVPLMHRQIRVRGPGYHSHRSRANIPAGGWPIRDRASYASGPEFPNARERRMHMLSGGEVYHYPHTLFGTSSNVSTGEAPNIPMLSRQEVYHYPHTLFHTPSNVSTGVAPIIHTQSGGEVYHYPHTLFGTPSNVSAAVTPNIVNPINVICNPSPHVPVEDPVPPYPYPLDIRSSRDGAHLPATSTAPHSYATSTAPTQRDTPIVPDGDLATVLAYATPDLQMILLRGLLYPLVDQVEHRNAANLTELILEMDNDEVLYLLESPESLRTKVSEASLVLRNREQLG